MLQENSKVKTVGNLSNLTVMFEDLIARCPASTHSGERNAVQHHSCTASCVVKLLPRCGPAGLWSLGRGPNCTDHPRVESACVFGNKCLLLPMDCV